MTLTLTPRTLMKTQENPAEHDNYERIESAIHYMVAHFKEQPTLETLAQVVHLSPFHFQRLFTRWAGVSPKKFIQFLSLNYAKELLKNKDHSLMETAYATGLSGSSRLHDLFVTLEGMTPGEYKQGGKGLTLNYGFYPTPFGQALVASTPKGICHLAFVHDKPDALAQLKERFPQATYQANADAFHQAVVDFFHGDSSASVALHLPGSPFQFKVWESLLKIPQGEVCTYGEIAHSLGQAQAARAVGSAVGKNPVAYLIPCHRVIQSTGHFGQYRWGATRKAAILGWEAAQASVQEPA